MTNPYTILGVLPSATDEEIKEAYRKLAKKYHPDINPDKELAEAKMKEINYAYDSIKKMRENNSTYNNNNSGYTNSYTDNHTYSNSNINYQTIERYIMARQYSLARILLMQMPKDNSRWYYYSSIIHFNLGDITTAENHIDTACAMEPDNYTYIALKKQMENLYYQRKQSRIRRPFTFGRLIFAFIKYYILFNILGFIIRLFLSCVAHVTPTP